MWLSVSAPAAAAAGGGRGALVCGVRASSARPNLPRAPPPVPALLCAAPESSSGRASERTPVTLLPVAPPAPQQLRTSVTSARRGIVVQRSREARISAPPGNHAGKEVGGGVTHSPQVPLVTVGRFKGNELRVLREKATEGLFLVTPKRYKSRRISRILCLVSLELCLFTALQMSATQPKRTHVKR
jgi:hypothetical protein